MDELQTSVTAAKKAGKELLRAKEIKVKDYKKDRIDFLTHHDLLSEKIIIGEIKKNFPDDMIISEETKTTVRRERRVWIIDPIDGTRNFTNRMYHYCVSIGFWLEGKPYAGVVYAPALDELYSSVSGNGVKLNGKKLKMLNPEKKLSESLVATGFAYTRGEELKMQLKTYEKVLNGCTDLMRFGAAAYDLCSVAYGRLGAYYEQGLKPWDVAAGMLFVKEQGGIVSDYNGGDVDIFRNVNAKLHVKLLASKNIKIHEDMLSILG